MMRGLVADAREAPQRAHPRRGGRRPRCGCRTATSPAASCPTRRSSVLDTACARVALGQIATPAAVEDCRRRIEHARDRDRRPRARERSPAAITASGSSELASDRTRDRDAARRARGALGAGAAADRASCAPSATSSRPTPRPRRQTARPTAEPSPPRSAEPARRPGRGSTPSSASVQGETPLMQVVRRRRRRSPRWSPAGPASRSARWSRTRSRPCSTLEDRLERARHRPGARARGDRPAHPHLARRPRRSRASPSACSCSSARAASARPRPRWRSPTCSTAASAT